MYKKADARSECSAWGVGRDRCETLQPSVLMRQARAGSSRLAEGRATKAAGISTTWRGRLHRFAARLVLIHAAIRADVVILNNARGHPPVAVDAGGGVTGHSSQEPTPTQQLTRPMRRCLSNRSKQARLRLGVVRSPLRHADRPEPSHAQGERPRRGIRPS